MYTIPVFKRAELGTYLLRIYLSFPLCREHEAESIAKLGTRAMPSTSRLPSNLDFEHYMADRSFQYQHYIPRFIQRYFAADYDSPLRSR
jgi:hypothetical protein